jgi:poly-gamma-glutamate capsule biosynthesis protein CapA/YwtB (metallophosphatase superfamily)
MHLTPRLLLMFVPIAALILGACGGGRTSPTRIESLSVAESVTGTPAALDAFGPDLNELMPNAALSTAQDDQGALNAVRSGAAVAAVVPRTAGAAMDGLSATDIEGSALAAFVPFTFPVEGLTIAQLRDLASGRITNWREVGGPALLVSVAVTEPDAISQTLGAPVAGVVADDAAIALAERPGRVVLALGSSAGVRSKPLRIDGIRPDEDGYPLEVRWSVVGQPGDERATALARALSARMDERDGKEVVLDAVGDIMLGRSVGRAITERGVHYPFEAARPLLDGSDVRAGNLELPLTERGSPARKDYTFRAPPSVTEGLVGAGFDVLTLANNHTLDYGADGLLDTVAALEQAGIAHPGAGRNSDAAHAPAIVNVNGLSLAFLSYVNTPNDGRSGWVAESTRAGADTPGVAWGTAESIRRDVAAVRDRADLVIVALHAGYEYSAAPNPVQRELAHAAVDAGAALVLGAHPHVLQGIEIYKRVPIVYSLGNFVFDVDSDDRRQPGMPSLLSAVLRIRLDADGVRGLEVRPAIIDERDGRPIPVSGAAARPVYERIYSLTDALNSGR